MSKAENPRAVAGDNSAPNVAGDQVKAFIERIERLEEDKRAIAGDIKDVFAEAKAQGFDTKILRRLIALRRVDEDERQETAALLDLYAASIGMRNVFA